MSTNASTDATPTSSQVEAPTSAQGTSLSSPLSSSTSSPISTADDPSTSSPASSDSGATTTNNAPTSTPATEATTTPTSQSTPAQTSDTTVATTSPLTSSPTSSASPTLTTPPATTSPTTFTTQVPTTFYTTDPAGSTVYITTTAPQVVTSSVDSSTGSSGGGSSSHTGVIVGAVVGGLVGIALLALLLFCIRKRARKDEFDGNFDPDRIIGPTDGGGGTLPHVDLAEEVTPFPQSYADQDSASMRQFGDSPYLALPTSPATSGQASTEFYPPGAADAQQRSFMQPGAGPPHAGAYLPPINMHGTGPLDWHTPRPGASPPPSTVSHNTSSTRAAKEREALERSGQGPRLGLATQPEAAEGSEDVVVHQDAGRAPAEEQAPPREIPPAYESIRQD